MTTLPSQRCPVCHQQVLVFKLEPINRLHYHLKRFWRIWALMWWNRRLAWCPGGFEPVKQRETT